MLTKTETGRCAALAKVRLTGGDVDAINDFFKILDGIDDIPLTPDDIEQDIQSMALREDIGAPSLPRALALANAKVTEAGCISVPKIL